MRDEIEYFYFFRNWWMMAEGRDTDEKRLAFYDAIFRYAFEGETPEKPVRGVSPGKVWAAYDAYLATCATVDQVLQKIRARADAGKKGGKSGTGESKARVGNQNASKSQANRKQIASKTQPIKIKDNDKDNDNDKIKQGGGIPARALEGTEDLENMFNTWWAEYPRKIDEMKCREIFLGILKSSEDPVSKFCEIMAGLERWKKCDTWTDNGGKFIRTPEVWLNNANWNDEPSPSGKSPIGIDHRKWAEEYWKKKDEEGK